MHQYSEGIGPNSYFQIVCTTCNELLESIPPPQSYRTSEGCFNNLEDAKTSVKKKHEAGKSIIENLYKIKFLRLAIEIFITAASEAQAEQNFMNDWRNYLVVTGNRTPPLGNTRILGHKGDITLLSLGSNAPPLAA
jgi:hypothetical protein